MLLIHMMPEKYDSIIVRYRDLLDEDRQERVDTDVDETIYD